MSPAFSTVRIGFSGALKSPRQPPNTRARPTMGGWPTLVGPTSAVYRISAIPMIEMLRISQAMDPIRYTFIICGYQIKIVPLENCFDKHFSAIAFIHCQTIVLPPKNKWTSNMACNILQTAPRQETTIRTPKIKNRPISKTQSIRYTGMSQLIKTLRIP